MALVALAIVGITTANAQDPLPSWNDGPAKQAIVEFVKTTTDQSNPKFVPAEARVATFDQDGTLWVEHPMYTQVTYCLERVPAVAEKKPELKNREPFKTVLSGDREAIAKLSQTDLMKILAATLTGMSVDDFSDEARQWLGEAKGMGGQKVSATGKVYNLNNLSDFQGRYRGISSGLTLIEGKMHAKLKNGNGVVMYLAGETEGLASSMGAQAFQVTLTD
jgi:hypothetical protein